VYLLNWSYNLPTFHKPTIPRQLENYILKKVKNKYILPPREFAKRVFKYAIFSICILVFSIGIGILGYHFIGQLEWIDSVYNASMILTGMGPVDVMKTDSAKLFASIYALFSGVVFLSTVAIIFAPFAHRIMHLFRIEELDEQE
jgi:hypothetical protein